MIEITPTELEQSLQHLGSRRIHEIVDLCHRHANFDIPGFGPATVLAFGSVETNLVNETGDGGHGRGIFQVDDRFNQGWLDSHRGCRDGHWRAIYATCLPGGRVPTLRSGLLRLGDETAANFHRMAEYFRIPKRIRFAYAIAAYNAGAYGAYQGHRHHGDVDANTATHDYSKRVLERRLWIADWLEAHRYVGPKRRR